MNSKDRFQTELLTCNVLLQNEIENWKQVFLKAVKQLLIVDTGCPYYNTKCFEKIMVEMGF
jgi:hypothetical protein